MTTKKSDWVSLVVGSLSTGTPTADNDQLIAQWFTTKRSGTGLGLTKIGHYFFKLAGIESGIHQMNVEEYFSRLNFDDRDSKNIRPLKHAIPYLFDKSIPCPYYILWNNRDEYTLELFDNKLCMYIVLKGGLCEYIIGKNSD